MADQTHDTQRQELQDSDQQARRFADRCYRAGWIIVAAAFVGILVAKVVLGPALAHTNLFLSGLGFLALLALGASLLGSGGVDKGFRPQRQASILLFDEVREIRDRQTRIEAAIERIAEALPHDQEIRHWKGFNAAVREGFAERTGTDGPPTRSGPVGRLKHLEIVEQAKS